MIRRQLITFGNRSTDFRMGFGAFDELSRMVSTIVGVPKRALLVSACDLESGHGLTVVRSLTDAGFNIARFAPGADAPVASLAQANRLYEAMDQAAITGDDLIVALGDADICSLAAFCARTWCGETPYVLLPTTLDAMVSVATELRPLGTETSDSMISVEPRASLVVCELEQVLEAESEDLKLGYVQLLAASLTDSRRGWDRFGTMVPGLVERDDIALYDALGMAQTARAAVLNSSNPSMRNSLRYGKTTARALRSLLGPQVPGYQLLAEGMRFEARVAHDVCDFNVDDVFEQDDRLDDLGIEELAFDIELDDFIGALRATRFKRANRFLLSLPRHAGVIRYSQVEDEVLERHARAYLASRADLVG